MNSFLTIAVCTFFLAYLMKYTVQTTRLRAFNRAYTPERQNTKHKTREILGVERVMTEEELIELTHNTMRPVDKKFLLKKRNFEQREQYVPQEMNA